MQMNVNIETNIIRDMTRYAVTPGARHNIPQGLWVYGGGLKFLIIM